MKHRFVTCDIFTSRVFGGNPLAVFPDAREIPEESLQQIASEFNLSETVFILPPADSSHTRRLRIFTPAAEIPFAGHPTVGAAFVLATLGEIALEGAETRVVFEEGVGPVPVLIRARDGKPTFTQLTTAVRPEIGPPAPGRSILADILSLEPADILGGMTAPQAVSCGLPFLIVPLKDRDAVRRAKVRLDHWESSLRMYWAPSIMVFARDAELEGSDIRARVFVPGLAVPEDPATGSAAAALGAYLGARDTTGATQLHYVVEQGFEMGRPSILEIDVEKADGNVTTVRVGGEAVMVSEGEITVPVGAVSPSAGG
ncbi:MAG TPA: PhzF family phenazine biosynthesis protein [Gemmatimonadaceae bacterium]|nr:PhzF family phenazine biosynthesis protein [Gemmatimonadaceae bacterium]